MATGMEFDADQPIFRQLATRIEQGILDGTYPEGSQIPSTNEFAAFLRINPATAKKAVGVLVDDELLAKRRGVGMFVTEGAQERLLRQRRDAFTRQYVHPLLGEAAHLGIGVSELIDLIRAAESESDQPPSTPTAAIDAPALTSDP